MRVMQQSIEQCCHGGSVTEQLAPVVDRPIGCQQREGAFVSTQTG
jgi:hypothetical protein